ncbi:zinc-dependent alcohol dehydrogenase [Frondihabitans sucicola]|nr:alcohol dehydrogenase catalytic domain-containing protein [Frondihabitans sucicola]
MPVPDSGEALIRVLWVGLCGSDLEEFDSGPIVARPGVILGHEIVGEVLEPAADGTGPRKGQAVIVDVVIGCGRCYWCQRHEEGLCPTLEVRGQTRDGGLAQYLTADASRLVVVPSGVPADRAALAEPVSVAVRALRKIGSLLGRSVVIYGGGTIGMLCAQLAQRGGASTVVVVEPGALRRSVIQRWGVVTMWADAEEERKTLLQGLLPVRGADVVVECSGRSGVAREAARVTRRGGSMLLLGVPVGEENMDLLDLMLAEKSVFGSAAHMWDDDVAVAVDLLSSGALDVDSMITHRVPLEDIGHAFRLLQESGEAAIKLLVDCSSAPGPEDEDENA